MAEAERQDSAATHLKRLQKALESGTALSVRRMLNALHPAEIAHLLQSLPPAEREIAWELVPAEKDGEVLLHVNDEVRAGLIRHMDLEELAAAVEGMDLDDLADLVQDLPETVSGELLRSMDLQDRQRLETVLSYPEDSAGGLMNTDAVTIRADLSLDVVLRYLRLRGELPDQTDVLIVVDRSDRYLGLLPISRLLIHSPDKTVGELMEREVAGIPADLPAQEVAKIFEQRDFISAPVVNEAGILLGRITIDDVVDVIRDQGEHALLSMSGLDEEEDMFAPVFISTRRRAVWLGINLVTAFMAAWVIGLFEGTLQQVVALAVLMPIVASMGGIAGSQTLTLMIRGLALGQIEGSSARWLIGKELAVGFLNGLIWAMVVAVIAVVWFGSWGIGAIIAVAILINLLAAALAGVAIPLLLKHLGVDPALAGSVVLTTVTDIVGFFAFLGLATVLLL
ncbi:MAG: magnesium transporter [Candidatus Competibacteraceae bacterium]|nr:magnesium transporter [Candidatus Competibacteraceae bacterium]